jgi:very-short-patch-repair endonuclease
VVDFCCPAQQLIIEIDGPIHEHQQEGDAARQQLLEDHGYRFLRFPAEQVETDLPAVVTAIRDALHP